MPKETHEFSAKIYKVGINPAVDLPEDVSRCLKKTGYIPVTGTLNGFPIRATLVPVGNGRHRLYINAEMRKKANVTVGNLIHLALALDTKPRDAPMPQAFAAALESNEKAKAAFEKLPPSHQKEILVYLNFLKKPETLQRNIAKVISILLKQEPVSNSKNH
jgi:hypothetical protein